MALADYAGAGIAFGDFVSLSFRLALKWHQFVHRLLRTLSRTYRESADLEYKLNLETSSHITSKAELANAQARLAAQSAQIQSLTIAASRGAEDAARYRDERDTAREQALAAREAAVRPLQQVMDWQAQGCPRRAIFGTAPESEPVLEMPEPGGLIHGRAAAKAASAAGYRTSLADLEQIKARQRAAREAAMAPIHIPAES